MVVSSSYGGDSKVWAYSHEIRQRYQTLQNFGWTCHAVGSYKRKSMIAATFPAASHCYRNYYHNMRSREDCPSGLSTAYALAKLGYNNVNLWVDVGVRDEVSQNSIISEYVH